MAAQGAADHLLAEQLGPESSHSEHMRHCIGVPAFAQHGHRDDTAYRVAEPSRFSYGVHDLTEQILVADLLGLAAVAGAFDDLATETLDFRPGHLAEARVEGLPGFELLTVDQEGPGARDGAAIALEVPNSAKRPFSTTLEPFSRSRKKPDM